MLDPETGVGAYQISGGASGGFLTAFNTVLKTMSYYLLFKNLVKTFLKASSFTIAPFVALLSGITEVGLKCKSQAAAHMFSGVLVVIALLTALLSGLYAFGPLGYVIFNLAVFVIKGLVVNMMLNTAVCRNG